MRSLLVGCLIFVCFGVICAGAAWAALVDEPIGQRQSLGVTLWHLGHNAEYIDGFHQYLAAHNIDPLVLDPPTNNSTTSRRILLDPERLPPERLNLYGANWAWTVNGTYVHGTVHDPGAGSPVMSMPLTITTAGRYRVWVRYQGWASGYGPTSLKLYRDGWEGDGPVFYDEVYDMAPLVDGWYWKDLIVDLAPGTYTLYVAHLDHGWRNKNGAQNGYCERNIDCLYLTNELWASAPTDPMLQELRATTPSGIQYSLDHTLTSEEVYLWDLWQVLPVAWEEYETKPNVFTQSHDYWRTVVDTLSLPDYGLDVPDYREHNRQNIFDETWNMMANPVRVLRQITTLQGDILPPDSPKLNEQYYWMVANEFDHQDGSGWWFEGTQLVSAWGIFDGVMWHDYPIDVPDTYYVWVHYSYNWVFGPWYMTVTNPQNQTIRFDFTAAPQGSPASGDMWERFATTIPMTAAGNLRLKVGVPQDQYGYTYRRINDVLITTDPDYTPQGTVRPPISASQYLARALGLGAGATYPYFLWMPTNAYTPVLQDQWPSGSVPSGDTSKSLSMVRNTHRAVYVPVRSIADTPVTLTVTPGSLGGYSGKVTWRVVSYDPYGGEYDRQAWTPFVLMKRPNITIPPYNLAGIWLDIDSTGVAPGDYTCNVVLSGAGFPDRTVTLNVHVSTIDTSSAQSVQLGGWTQPPEGEVYLQDYAAHGMNIWYGEMSKAEMDAYDIKLLSIGMWTTDQTYISSVINRLLGAGLTYNDFVCSVMDEPNGSTQAELQGYIDIANAIHAVDPNVRVSFNPGEAASLATFQILDPYCQVWLPYSLHTNDSAKMAIITAKPWFWYTTPDLWDKSPTNPLGMYSQIRWVPGQTSTCFGTAFFAFNYMWRDHWDTGYEVVSDEAETVLPSRHGPVPTRVWDAIREGTQDAKLAFMVKARLGGTLNETERNFVVNATTEELIAWLENPAPAMPTFSPTGGVYPIGQAQPVTISTTTTGASIRYTTDGTTPSSTVGTLYTGPVSLTSTTTLKAVAYRTDLNDSAVASDTYSFLTQCGTPTFTPATGGYNVYFGGQAVAISTTTPDATIRYTIDGTTPTATTGAVYTTPIPFSDMPVKLKAIAYKSGMADSAVGAFQGTCTNWTKMTTLDSYADGATFSDGTKLPSVGDLANWSNGYYPTFFTYGSPQMMRSGANTLDGHPAIYFPANGRLETGSSGGNGIDGGNYQTVAFIMKTTADNCVLFRDGGTLALVIKDGKLRLASRVYNGGHWGGWACDPYLLNPAYLGPNVTHPTTVNNGVVHTVVLIMSSGNTLAIYVDGVGASTSTGGFYGPGPANQGNAPQMGSCTGGGSAQCAGETPMPNMFTGTIGEILIFSNVFSTTEAQAMDAYLRIYNTPAQCVTPTFAPAPGTYGAAQTVTISTTTNGATIRYTTDGSTPTSTTGTVYSAPVAISTNTTLQAIAYKAGMTDSTVASGVYNIQCATPTFNPAAGTYGTAQTVTISTTTSGATIRYTTDGTDPTSTTGTVYSTPVAIDSTKTLKAIAYKTGMTDSAVASGTYTITGVGLFTNTQDIGSVGLTGSASYAGSTYTVAGAGAGITGTADAFRIVYKQITGDFTITARVASFTSSRSNARAGVMVRQNTNANSIEASSLFYPGSNKRVYFHRRTSAGGSTSTSNGSASAAPYWVRLVRTGNTLKAYRSANGTSWTQVGSNTTVTMTNPVLIGLAVTSGSTTATTTATFDNVTISQP